MIDDFDLDAILAEYSVGEAEPKAAEEETSIPAAPTMPEPAPERAVEPEEPEKTEPEKAIEPEPEEEPDEEPQKRGRLRRNEKETEPEEEPEEYGEDEEDYDDDGLSEIKPRRVRIGVLRRFVALIFIALLAAALGWTAMNIHPDIGVSETMTTKAKLELINKINVFANNSKSDALGDLAYIRKIYTIDRSAPCAPKPDASRFVSYANAEAAKVNELIDRARESGLLEGQDVIFDPNANFYWDSEIKCYLDDTIMVICWKELINGRVCSCVEVKLADASQFRRKLTEDYFGSSVLQYNSQMSAAVNAVTAMNADFYVFRPYGVAVNQGEIFRYNTSVDTMFVDDKGDFSFLHRFDDPGREALQQRIYEDHVQFSLCFGPILIENGAVQHLSDNYGGLGEANEEYSRAGIGQFDTLHYLYMTVNHSNDGTPRCTVNQFADIIGTKNLKSAYNLDGGQTSEITLNGEVYNHVDWGEERLVSDMIYFATAIPESEVGK